MKKIIFLMLLSVFSMYYTNFSINLLRQKDPIMQEIKEKKDSSMVVGLRLITLMRTTTM